MKKLEKWIRLDARGNKESLQAEMGEKDDPGIYAEPLRLTMDILENSTDALPMCLHSPPAEI